MAYQDCIKRIQNAAKRELTEDEVQAIFERINTVKNDIAAGRIKGVEAQNTGMGKKLTGMLNADLLGDPSLAKTGAEAIQEAAQWAAADKVAEADLKERRANLQVLATVATDNRIRDMKRSAMKVTQSQAYARDMQNSSNYIDALHKEAVTDLKDMLDAASSKEGVGPLRNLAMRLFDLDNPRMTMDIVREIFAGADGHTGNKAAQLGAKAWLAVIEKLRVRFNKAGGDIGKLGYGYLSQIHDAARIIKVTAADWAARVLPLVDRNQYLNGDGAVMADAELLPVLEQIHATLASGGLNKIEPGQYRGSGARAKSGSEARVLHFKDGNAWMAYMQQFGEGTLYDAMMGHIGHMVRNIGLLEKYGPDPEMQHRLQADIAMRADNPLGKSAKEVMDARSWGNTTQAYWDILSGKTGSPENEALANGFRNVRNIKTAALLGRAVISSFADIATVGATLHYNRLPYFQMFKHFGTLTGQRLAHVVTVGHMETSLHDFLETHGILAEHAVSTLNRFTGDNLTHNLTGRVANAVMKISLMNAWTDGWRRAFSATMMHTFAKKTGADWAALDEWDRWLMGRKDITEADWAVISRAQPTERGTAKYLTYDSILATGEPNAEQIATKWMAFVSDEAQFASVNPDLATRAMVTFGGAPAGTLRGEAARTFWQFKSFPTAMITRHWGRIFDTPQGLAGAPAGFGAKTSAGGRVNRVATISALGVSSMMLGAIALQTKALLDGKDPYDMTTGKFWVRAYAQGGGTGYIGDLFTKDPENQSFSTEQAVGSAFGPVAGTAAGIVYDLGLRNFWRAARGEKTDFGAEALRLANSNLPGANLWETKALWEHWFLNNAQEALNPGYLRRMRRRAMKDWQQDYYWPPGEALPKRAPDMARAVGE